MPPSPLTKQVAKTVAVLSEGMKYDAANKDRKVLMAVLEKVIGHSLFLTEVQRVTYLSPLRLLSYDDLILVKDAFIRENLRFLNELVRKHVIERQIIEGIRIPA